MNPAALQPIRETDAGTKGSDDIPQLLENVRTIIRSWLKLLPQDEWAIEVTLGTVLANADEGSDPVAVLLVGPPSSAKSEFIRAVGNFSEVYPISSLTSKTLLSGAKGAKSKSLLHQFNEDHVSTLSIKDLGTILSLQPTEKASILAQLREVYDGQLVRPVGTGENQARWDGKLGSLAAATPAIEKHYAIMGELGDRFLFFRMASAERVDVAAQALDGSGHEQQMRREIQAVFAELFYGLTQHTDWRLTEVAVSARRKQQIAQLAELVTRLRSAVPRDSYSKEVCYMPQFEGPARFAKALYQLGRAVTRLRGKSAMGEDEFAVLARICADTLPAMRKALIAALHHAAWPERRWLTVAAITEHTRIPFTTAKVLLEDLYLLRVCDRQLGARSGGDKGRRPYQYRLCDDLLCDLTVSGLELAFVTGDCDAA